MNVELTKMTAEGESLQFTFSMNNEKDQSKLANAFAMADSRLREMNTRYLEALKTVEEFPAELRLKVRMLIDCLHGHRLDQLSKIPHLRLVPKDGGSGEPSAQEAPANGAPPAD